MAHQWYRFNLASAIFPFETDLSGRTVIMPGVDQNYNYLNQIGEPVKDPGLPQIFYCHNVLPTPQGYQSVGYTPQIPPLAAATDFDTILPLNYTSPETIRVLFAPAAGKNYIFDGAVGAWESISPITAGTLADNILVTTAYIDGSSYFFYSGYGLFVYDPVNKVMVSKTMTGLTVANIIGIVGSVGYMIAYDNAGNVSWSSATNPLDFSPSLITGAGGGALQYSDGQINFGAPIANGFLIYCERNVVAAQYSGNINFPWIFKEVEGSCGVATVEQITYRTNSGFHYAWTTAGLQQITANSATTVFPEASMWLAGLSFEDFDEPSLTFSQQFLGQPLFLKLAFIANRYFVISYGIEQDTYTHAIILDGLLSRWGKVKITHRKCFEWSIPNLYGALTYDELDVTYNALFNTTYDELGSYVNQAVPAQKNIAFLQMDGTILTVDTDLSEATADGVLLLGKFQVRRNNWIIAERVDIENVEIGNNFATYLIPTYDGKNFETPFLISQPPYLLQGGPKVWKMGADSLNGLNVSILLTGGFNIVSGELDFQIGAND